MSRSLIRMTILVVILVGANAEPTSLASSPRRVYTTYAGTGPNSYLYALAVDSQGYVYVGGSGPASGNSKCGFLTKLNQAGTAAVWSVCLPITEVDRLVLDSLGYIYVVGSNAPTNYASIVMKLTPDAKQTIYSIQIGGFYDVIALDAAGNVYLAGGTDSTIQATPGVYMPTAGGAYQAFVAKLNTVGSIAFTTFLDLNGVGAIAVDSMGATWIVGTTCPAIPGQMFNECSASSITPYAASAAIRKLDATGAHLLVSNTFGGGPIAKFAEPLSEAASGVAVDSTDDAWIVGVDETAAVPTTANALQPQRPGPVGTTTIGFALKLSSSGDLIYGSYIGEYASTQPVSTTYIAVDSNGRPCFPTNLGVIDGSRIMVLSADGTSVLASTVFADTITDIALDGSGGLYVAGTTDNTMFFSTLGAYQALYPGGSKSGYAAKFDLTTPASATRLLWMANAGSFFNYPEAPVAPGEIVTLFGQNLPSNPVVTFDGRSAPILYASASQINTVVPFEVSPPTTTVMLQGAGGFVLPVWPAVAGLFTLNGSGTGHLAALNQDGTVNSSTNPAKIGSVVAVYMTGVGAMTPPLADGQLGPLQPPYPLPVLGVSALMNNSFALSNGIPAPVLFAGQAPGLISGAIQVNIQIPPGVPSGNVSLTVYVGNYETQLGPVTIAVQ